MFIKGKIPEEGFNLRNAKNILEIALAMGYVKVVKTPEDLAGVLSSDIVYIIDGVIDFTGTGLNITVPVGGLSIIGFSIDNFGLVCTDDDYTLFVSEDGVNSGNLFSSAMYVSTSGSNSQVMDLTDVDGTHAVEFNQVNFLNCTSRGTLTNYRQGLEEGCGMFGGSPELTLSGPMEGGWRITTTNIFGISPTTTALFKAGPGLTMDGRFISDINCDLGDNAAFFDFSPANFTYEGSVQLKGCQIVRNDVADPNDFTVTPNMRHTDLSSDWRDNRGVRNTSNGGKITMTSQSAITIGSAGTYYDAGGVWDSSNLDHFSSSSGTLQNEVANPSEFMVIYDLKVIGQVGDEVGVRLVKWDDSEGVFETVVEGIKAVENFIVTDDNVEFQNTVLVELDEGDYVKPQFANLTDTTAITVADESYVFITRR